MINLDDKQSKGTHWISLFFNRHMTVLFDFFGIEYISQELLSKIIDKSITHNNISRIQDDDSIICGFYCTIFKEHMLAGKALLDYTKLFSPNNYKRNDKTIFKYFNPLTPSVACLYSLKT